MQFKQVWALICGIIYSVSWSISFYGQVYENWKYKSVQGYSLNYQVFNMSGYLFYGFYCTIGFFLDIQGAGTVVVSDLIFVYHALLMVAILTYQSIIYEKGKNRISEYSIAICILLWLFVMTETFLAGIIKVVPYYEYFNPVACLGYSKLVIGFVKYTPPVYYNYKRKSTKGWSIWNIIFDLLGGIFSFASGSIQIGNGLNITKLILAILTIVFDLIFIVQHYCIYPKSNEKQSFYLDELPKQEQPEPAILGADQPKQEQSKENIE